MKAIDGKILKESLSLLENQIKKIDGDPLELVVCGGSALIVTNLVSRTTKDIDILAMKNGENPLTNPHPLPDFLIDAAEIVSKILNLPDDWINTEPADLFRMGLPENFESRLITKKIGPFLTIHYISRLDQIHFKLYASVDRQGYHIEDLLALNPTENELIMAAKWTFTHDVSIAFASLTKEMLTQLGFENAAAGI